MSNDDKVVELLEEMLKSLKRVESELSSISSNTGDIYYIKDEAENIVKEVKAIKRKID